MEQTKKWIFFKNGSYTYGTIEKIADDGVVYVTTYDGHSLITTNEYIQSMTNEEAAKYPFPINSVNISETAQEIELKEKEIQIIIQVLNDRYNNPEDSLTERNLIRDILPKFRSNNKWRFRGWIEEFEVMDYTPEKLSQYSAIMSYVEYRDKNGTPIYKKDTIETENPYTEQYEKYVVNESTLTYLIGKLDQIPELDFLIVGNILQNPEIKSWRINE